MLDPYVLFTFKGIQQRGALPEAAGVLDPYVLLTLELSREGELPAQERSSQKLLGVLDPYVLLTFKGTQQRGGLASPGERLPEAAGGAGSLRPPYF